MQDATVDITLTVDDSALQEAQTVVEDLEGSAVDVEVTVDDAGLEDAKTLVDDLEGATVDVAVSVDDAELEDTKSKVEELDGSSVGLNIKAEGANELKEALAVVDTELIAAEGSAVGLAGALAGAKVAALGLAIPIVAIAGISMKSAADIGGAFRSIARETLATGPALESYKASFKSVFSSVPADAKEVVGALDVIINRLHVTGPALEQLTTQVVLLSTMTGTDAKANADAFTGSLKAWGEKAPEATLAMDKLFVISQKNSISFESLSTVMARAALVAPELGLSYDTTAIMMANMTAAGLPARQSLSMLNKVATESKAAGISGAAGWAAMIQRFKEGKETKADIDSLGASVVKFRNMSKAGLFDTAGMQANLTTARGAIQRTYAETASFSENMKTIMNKLEIAMQPLGVAIYNAFKSMLPTLIEIIGHITNLVNAFTSLDPNIQKAILAFGAIVIAVTIAIPIITAFGAAIAAIGGFATAAGVGLGLVSAASVGTGVAATGATAGVVGLTAAFASLVLVLGAAYAAQLALNTQLAYIPKGPGDVPILKGVNQRDPGQPAPTTTFGKPEDWFNFDLPTYIEQAILQGTPYPIILKPEPIIVPVLKTDVSATLIDADSKIRVPGVAALTGMPATTSGLTNSNAGIRAPGVAALTGMPATTSGLTNADSAIRAHGIASLTGMPATTSGLTNADSGIRAPGVASLTGMPSTTSGLTNADSGLRVPGIAALTGMPATGIATITIGDRTALDNLTATVVANIVTSGPGSAASASATGASGGVVLAMASGGIIGSSGINVTEGVANKYGVIARGPTLVMAGEAGDEAFIPLKGGKVPVSISGGVGGNTYINVSGIKIEDVANEIMRKIKVNDLMSGGY